MLLVTEFKKALSLNEPIARVKVGEITVDSSGEILLTPAID